MKLKHCILSDVLLICRESEVTAHEPGQTANVLVQLDP
jgi:hypothetical protein